MEILKPIGTQQVLVRFEKFFRQWKAQIPRASLENFGASLVLRGVVKVDFQTTWKLRDFVFEKKTSKKMKKSIKNVDLKKKKYTKLFQKCRKNVDKKMPTITKVAHSKRVWTGLKAFRPANETAAYIYLQTQHQLFRAVEKIKNSWRWAFIGKNSTRKR